LEIQIELQSQIKIKGKGDFMSEEHNNKRQFMDISLEQQKVILNPLRSRIISLLHKKAMTPKELSDELGKNPGTVYYHVQQLVKHDIIEVETTRTVKGIVEKLYRSKAVYFRNPAQNPPKGMVESGTTNVYLSKKLMNQLNDELIDLFYKFNELSNNEKDTEEQDPYVVEYVIKEYEGEDE